MPGGAEDEDRLAGGSGPARRSPTQDDVPGFIAAAIATTCAPWGRSTAALVDQRALGHGSGDAVVADEEDEAPIRRAAERVKPGPSVTPSLV